MMNKRKIITIISIAVVIVLTGTITFNVIKAKRQEEKKLTANEWFLDQTDYLNNILNFLDSMDTVYSLYLSGSMSKTDFVNYNTLLKQQYAIMDNEYEQYKRDNPIKMGTQSYISQSGIEAINNIRSEERRVGKECRSRWSPYH